jgi:hypothetical protein
VLRDEELMVSDDGNKTDVHSCLLFRERFSTGHLFIREKDDKMVKTMQRASGFLF